MALLQRQIFKDQTCPPVCSQLHLQALRGLLSMFRYLTILSPQRPINELPVAYKALELFD